MGRNPEPEHQQGASSTHLMPFELVENKQTTRVQSGPRGGSRFQVSGAPGSADCDSPVRVVLQLQLLVFLLLHCISSHRGARPGTVKTEE